MLGLRAGRPDANAVDTACDAASVTTEPLVLRALVMVGSPMFAAVGTTEDVSWAIPDLRERDTGMAVSPGEDIGGLSISI